jgi:hypothetical protein
MTTNTSPIKEGRYQFGWIIHPISKDGQFVIELADLGNGKYMIVATDVGEPIATSVWRQAGYGPFVYKDGDALDIPIDTLKKGLLQRRPTTKEEKPE